MGYIGNEPTTGHFPVDNFTSSGGSTYTLAKAPASAGAIEVSVQGVLQPTTAYTVSGSTLTMAGVTTGVKIFVRHLGETLSLPPPADGSVTTDKLGTNSLDGTKIAMGSDARGDILYHGATDYARLAKGTSGQVLTMGANDPAWAAAGGGYELVSEQTNGSAVTRFTVTGLDLDAAKSYHVELELVGASGSGPIYLYANGLETDADYHYQLHGGDNTTTVVEEGNYPRISFLRQGGSYKTKCNIDISYWSGRHFVAIAQSLREDGSGTNDYAVELNSVTKDAELVANLTQLDFKNSDTNGIAAGSKIRVYKK